MWFKTVLCLLNAGYGLINWIHQLTILYSNNSVTCTGVKPTRFTHPGTNRDERCLTLWIGQPLYQRHYKSRLLTWYLNLYPVPVTLVCAYSTSGLQNWFVYCFLWWILQIKVRQVLIKYWHVNIFVSERILTSTCPIGQLLGKTKGQPLMSSHGAKCSKMLMK